MRFILFGLLSVCASVYATPISFTANGTVDTVTASLPGSGVDVGDAVHLDVHIRIDHRATSG
jgi:hypothetical protein